LPRGGVAVVFGASGGVGSALVEQLRASECFAQVVGLSRRSAPRFDLTDEASIANAVAQVAALGDLRLVIDATGFLHDEAQSPEKSLRDLDAGKLARAFALNAIGPALLMKHALPALAPNGKAVFATLSARVGSIGDNHLGGWYGYRASKAALNQLVRTAAIELKRRRPAALCVALHPGTVRTELSSPFSKDGLEVQTPQTSAARLLGVIDGLNADQSGEFFDHLGVAIPW
jgi:NAD(P)-dependent dehydrogenase (short-subunit alcohol dehydrogenase family)